MARLTDEVLMAFVDGELSAEDHRAVADHLNSNPEDMQRTEAFRVSERGSLAKYFNEDVDTKIPEALLQAVDQFQHRHPPAAPYRRPTVSKTWPRRIPATFQEANWASIAALGLTLVVGGVLGWSVSSWDSGESVSDGTTPVIAKGVLHDVLESDRSGQKPKTSNNGNAGTLLSFKTTDGTYCRQYYMSKATNEAFSGIACRREDGHWHVKIQTPTAVHKDASADYVPASHSESQAIRGFIDDHIAGDVLTVDQESKLIGQSWRARN